MWFSFCSIIMMCEDNRIACWAVKIETLWLKKEKQFLNRGSHLMMKMMVVLFSIIITFEASEKACLKAIWSNWNYSPTIDGLILYCIGVYLICCSREWPASFALMKSRIFLFRLGAYPDHHYWFTNWEMQARRKREMVLWPFHFV